MPVARAEMSYRCKVMFASETLHSGADWRGWVRARPGNSVIGDPFPPPRGQGALLRASVLRVPEAPETLVQSYVREEKVALS